MLRRLEQEVVGARGEEAGAAGWAHGCPSHARGGELGRRRRKEAAQRLLPTLLIKFTGSAVGLKPGAEGFPGGPVGKTLRSPSGHTFDSGPRN